jgi:hypothetical protein
LSLLVVVVVLWTAVVFSLVGNTNRAADALLVRSVDVDDDDSVENAMLQDPRQTMIL